MTMAGDERPDPDAVLARLKRTAQSASRGRLRIYFGASAGVGKTYAMLQAARRLKAEGHDVLVGVVECHGRAETLALMQGAEAPPQLPAKTVEYRGHTLSEFDLDAALARAPEVLIVDELAHQNVPGSRHPKRWQDVEELLAAGIDVYTALNVQHLESLSEVVGGIAEVKVRETVPDTFFDSAHEVILVDVPADELLKRLDSGKVYLAAEAERAAKNFFRRGNLMALRELALRRTADRLEGEVQEYRSDEAIKPVWRTEASMVCGVGPDASAETVVRAAARLASQTATTWHAVYVETPRLQRLSSPERERILGYVKLAQQLGGRTTVLVAADGDVAARLVEYARTHNCSRILLGQRQRRRAWWPGAGIAQAIVEHAPEMDLIEFALPPASPPSAALGRSSQTHARADGLSAASLRPYAWAVAGCLASIAVGSVLVPFVHLTNLAMLFLLTVALTAMRWGRAPAIVSAILNVAAYDFFFVPPRFSFAVSDIQYLFTFIVMLVVGLIIAELTARLRFQARVAEHREERAQALYEFARDLSAALRVEDVVMLSVTAVSRSFRAEAQVIASGMDGRLAIPPELARLPNFEPAIAAWVFEKGESAGLGTDTLPGSSWLYVPLRAPSRTRGVLALRPKARRLLLVPEQARQLETFAALVAVALERVHYVSVAQDALVGMEGERLRNSILSAVSHDLRTPLAAVVGLADSLTLTRPSLSAQQQEVAAAIAHEAHRMNALVNNLLDMARIESGAIHMNLQWQPIEEVIGSALQATRLLLAGHAVSVSVAPDLPLVQFDAVLIERVLVNLLENAAKYTPAGTSVSIEATREGSSLAVRVADRGPGLPPGREEALFAKFARGAGAAAAPGVGLGLAICRAIVEAHGGRIRWEPRDGPGSCFHFTLPLGDPPAVAYEADEDFEHV